MKRSLLVKLFKKMRRSNQQYELVNQMLGELIACRALAEALTVMQNFAPQLFPGASGTLFLRQDVLNADGAGGSMSDAGFFERCATWGSFRQYKGKKRFMAEHCFALHRMRCHVVPQSGGLVCPHIHLPRENSCLCLPLLYHGQAIGVLHLQNHAISGELDASLAEKLASHCALVLGNLWQGAIISQRSIRDALTGLYNRRFMEETLRRELSARSKRAVSTILIDIDHFKKYNTQYTHSGGDALLRAFGDLLRSHIRSEDVACRFGGEEFLVILPGAGLEVARQRAEQLRLEVKKLKVSHHDRPLGPITISLGVAASEVHGRDAGKLLEAATGALCLAKEEGRDRVVIAARPNPQGKPASIFLSYRRADSQDVTSRIRDHLTQHFSQVFMDVNNMPLAVPFPQHLREVLSKVDAVLVVIGPSWLARDQHGHCRLDDPEDFVRMEIETALSLNVGVIPITVSDAQMPPADDLPEAIRDLAFRTGQAVRRDPDFRRDMDDLIQQLAATVCV